MEELLNVALNFCFTGWLSSKKKTHLHYKASNKHVEQQIIDALQNRKCKVYRYSEDFYESKDNAMTVKKISNHEYLFGEPNNGTKLDDYWVIKKNISTTHPFGGLLFTKETKPTHDPKTEKVLRFNIIGFDIMRTEHHVTTFDIVFLNGFNNQYFLVCCEKFSAMAPESYKKSCVNNLANIESVQACIPKYNQYLEHYKKGNYSQIVSKLNPSMKLINSLIDNQNQETLSLVQIECLMILCQQISLRNQNDFEKLVEQLENAPFNKRSNLFSEIIGHDRWNVEHNSIQVFKSWAFFPLQRLTQPFLHSTELVYESPHLYRYLVSCKYGNLFAGHILVLIYKVEDEDSPLFKLAEQCQVPKSIYKPQSTLYPFILLRRNRRESDNNNNYQDPRLWYFHPTNLLHPNDPKVSNFKKYLFGYEWYLLYLFVLGLHFEEHFETVKSLLKQHNLGLYYHFLREAAIDVSQRTEYSKQAVSFGITDDLDLINATTTTNDGDRFLWGFLAGLLKREQLEEMPQNNFDK